MTRLTNVGCDVASSPSIRLSADRTPAVNMLTVLKPSSEIRGMIHEAVEVIQRVVLIDTLYMVRMPVQTGADC